MSYQKEPWGSPRNDPFFSDYFDNVDEPPKAVWPDHCKQSQSNRKFSLSPQPVFDENFVPPHGDTITALAKSRYLEKEKEK